MITLLHGDNTEASRAVFRQMKEAAVGKEIRVLDGRTLDETKLTQALESSSMFGGDAIVFIENLFGKLGRQQKLIESLSAIIKGSSADVVLWEDKEVGVTVTKSLGQADVRLFKTPVVLFQFLDGLTPKCASKLLPVYQGLIEKEAPELVSTMIARRLRQLIQLSDGVTPAGLQGWQATKLTHQAKLFTMDRLLFMYKKLLEMEFSIKNGSSPFSLSQLTEQFIIDL